LPPDVTDAPNSIPSVCLSVRPSLRLLDGVWHLVFWHSVPEIRVNPSLHRSKKLKVVGYLVQLSYIVNVVWVVFYESVVVARGLRRW